MKIEVEKVDNLYYLVITNFDSDITKYIIKKSWDSSYIDEVPASGNQIYNNDLLIYKKELELTKIKLPNDELKAYNDLYFVNIYFGDSFQNIYIDYNMFHNIKTSEKIFKHNFGNNLIKSKRTSLYKVYIEGNYGDIHQAELFYRINSDEALIKISDLNYSSEIYNIILEKNKEVIYKGRFNVIIREQIEFSVNKVIDENYIKLSVAPKYNYPFLIEYYLEYNGYKYSSKNIIIKKELSNKILNIHYKLKDSSINNEIIEDKFVYKLNFISNEVISYEHKYDYNKDCLYIKLNKTNKEKLNYKISSGDFVYYYSNDYFVIENFSKFNNNSDEITLKLFYSSNYDFNKIFDIKMPNYIRINKLEKFNPVIDYSKSLDVHKDGVITWSTPNCKFTSKIKVEVKNIKAFLDEYLNIWNKNYILDQEVSKFDEKYPDYNKEIEYDFPRNNETFLKKPYDCLVSYDGLNNDFIDLGETNNYNLNLWFCESGYKYKITVEIYNAWNIKVGENFVEFALYENYIGEVSEDWLIFGRNQNIQFGETGTIGEFYKLNNPTPIQVMRSYSEKYKTFTGKALRNQLNIDNNNKSLYYYMNLNTDNYFFIKYYRNFNFYKFEYKLINNDSEVISEIHEPLGNSYDDNIIKIKRNLFKEGENILQIRTFNSEGIASEEKQFTFLASNDKPKTPYVIINPGDYYEKDDKIIINKKYFQLTITNNEQSEKYAGWNFKEAHFFLKKTNSLYNEYADYVVIASKEDGSIVLNNNTEIENGEYDCKVVTYDYFGNQSDPFEFNFKLISEIKIEPEVLFTNKVDSKFIWNIKKSQDSEGFYYYFKYSDDGLNYQETSPVKVESPYYINDSSTEQNHELSINFIQDEYLKYKEGIYILVVYEYNLKHLEGLKDYTFESKPVEVYRTSNSSYPIYAKKTENNNVINAKQYNEYSYTNDINSIEFETIHSVDIFDNEDTPEIEGQRYSIELISPDGNTYSCNLPLPTEIGMYKFTNILDKANVENPIEGVWELRFITIDKYGNSNAYRGYYTYYIVYIKRNPKISILNPNTNNGSNIFGLNSNSISYIYDTNNNYSDILNFEEHKDKFIINNFKLRMNYNPLGSTYEININSNDNYLQVLNSLTENDKITHIRDGKYSISILCIDPLGRESLYIDRIFYIDTRINGELLFLNNNIFNSKTIDLVALCNGDVSTVLYSLDENNEDVETWNKIRVGYIDYNSELIYGINIENLSFDSDGKKFIKYILEEESGNRTDILYYYFNIDTDIKLLPTFDFNNKIYYLINDRELNFSWNLTNEDVNHFYYKLDRIKILENGSVEIVESYMPSSDGSLLPVGPQKNDFVDIGSDRNLTIPLIQNGWLINGYYNLTIKGLNVYGSSNSNSFRFNINLDIPIDIEYEIINNKITLDNNIISWNHIKDANHYEVSYDGFNWIRVIDSRFIINPDNVIKDINSKTYLYMRWVSYNGIYSNISKIEINLSITKLLIPDVKFYENKTITDNNNKLEWSVTIGDVPNAKYLYYSFDNEKWYSKKIKNSIEKIINDDVEYPVVDGRYGIFVKTTDGDSLIEKYINTSDVSYSYIDVFADKIPKPIFSGITNGQTFNLPIRLMIENKLSNVQYFIYLNNMLVQEGYEIASYNLARYTIVVKAKKNGIEKIEDVLSYADNFHIFSKVEEKYSINIGDKKAICYIDSDNEYIIINSMPSKKSSEVIFYREKNKNQNWNILNIGDKLSLNLEWEFKITTFETL